MTIKKKTITTLTILLLIQTFGLNAMASLLEKEGYQFIKRAQTNGQLAKLVGRLLIPNGKSKSFDALPHNTQEGLRDAVLKNIERGLTLERKKIEDATKTGKLITAIKDGIFDDTDQKLLKKNKEYYNDLEKRLPSNINNINPDTGQLISIELLNSRETRQLLLDYMQKNPGKVDVHQKSMGKLDKEGNLINSGKSLFSIFENAKKRITDGLRRPFHTEEEELAVLVQEHAKK